MESKQQITSNFGLLWSTDAVPIAALRGFSLRNALSLDLALQAQERTGAIKLLSKPEIALRVPGEAELFSGGEKPVFEITRSQMRVQWKSFGLKLILKATHQTASQVRLEITTDASQLDSQLGSDGVPGLSINRMKTQVDALFDTPLYLSGLQSWVDKNSGTGLPWLQSIPVLGWLFGSRGEETEKKSISVILIPLQHPPQTEVPTEVVTP